MCKRNLDDIYYDSDTGTYKAYDGGDEQYDEDGKKIEDSDD